MIPRTLISTAGAVLVLASPAAAAPSISAHPAKVHRGQFLVVTGKGWAPSSPRTGGMFFGIRRPGDAIHLGNADVSASGRFRFEYRIGSFVGLGRWRLKARQDITRADGTVRQVRRSVRIGVLRKAR